MDPLTHALTGAALAVVFAPAGRLRQMAVAGAAVAALPDLDVLLGSAADPLLKVELHRHFSHALLLAPMFAAVVAAIGTWLYRDGFIRWWLGVLPSAISAGLLDACTSYGTHLFWPFTDERDAYAIVAVVDPVLTVVLLVLLLASVVRRQPVFAGFGLVFAASYLMLGTMQQSRADWAMRSLAESRGHSVERSVVKPTLGNLLVWRTLYVHAGRVYAAAVRVGLSSDSVLYPGTDVELVVLSELGLPQDSTARIDVQRFARLSQGYLVWHPQRQWVIGDVRYAISPDATSPMFALRIDPSTPQAHPEYLELRDWSPAAWQRFKAMLAGEPLPRAQMENGL